MIACARCGREREALAGPPVPGATGEEIAARVCAGCWEEWTAMEIKVINELRLNFMDPAAQATLTSHMRDFLFPCDDSSVKPGERLDFDSIGEP
ncbi:MAG: Fe(2+)-trafficking protein [Acidobacteriota bacterium]|nr:Fe(2+)-trafficking protein [Acidobacteriota bacterium]MDE2923465.1 Fe(2+)-trafficking protein [Acidobacteriota bacterium]MDE3263696.1 Fe(2+)-trafficking protein [Acidobacteriota bacterium]